MVECDYCSASFDDDEAYYTHLDSEHADELGPIDRRRVEQHVGGGGSELPTGPLALVGVIGFAVVLVVYVTVFLGGGASSPAATINGIGVVQTPGSVQRSAHGHGPINVTIAGEQIDFSQPQFQNPQAYPKFHFEDGNGSIWHKHAAGVTLQYAMATVGINVTTSTVTYDGTTYRDSDSGTSVRVLVDGDPVDPSTYELHGPADIANAAQGDSVHIVVTTNSTS